jgi:hypothetical protein
VPSFSRVPKPTADVNEEATFSGAALPIPLPRIRVGYVDWLMLVIVAHQDFAYPDLVMP